MLPDPACFADGSVSVEAGCMEMLTRMESGRFKVFDHLNDWFSEFRMYHRLEGKIVPEYDDLLSATRYAVERVLESFRASGAKQPALANRSLTCSIA